MTAPVDEVMPVFDATRVERLAVQTAPGQAFDALRSTDFLAVHSRLMDTAVWLRGLPLRLRGREVAPPPQMTIASLFDAPADTTYDASFGPWVPLREVPGRELVLGVVGRFWSPTITWRRVSPQAFPAFAEPGWGSIVAALSVAPTGAESCVLTYEARTRCHDAGSRRAFRRYWTLVSPFVGHIERALLRDVAARAVRTGASGPRARSDVLD